MSLFYKCIILINEPNNGFKFCCIITFLHCSQQELDV